MSVITYIIDFTVYLYIFFTIALLAIRLYGVFVRFFMRRMARGALQQNFPSFDYYHRDNFMNSLSTEIVADKIITDRDVNDYAEALSFLYIISNNEILKKLDNYDYALISVLNTLAVNKFNNTLYIDSAVNDIMNASIFSVIKIGLIRKVVENNYKRYCTSMIKDMPSDFFVDNFSSLKGVKIEKELLKNSN